MFMKLKFITPKVARGGDKPRVAKNSKFCTVKIGGFADSKFFRKIRRNFLFFDQDTVQIPTGARKRNSNLMFTNQIKGNRTSSEFVAIVPVSMSVCLTYRF